MSHLIFGELLMELLALKYEAEKQGLSENQISKLKFIRQEINGKTKYVNSEEHRLVRMDNGEICIMVGEINKLVK